MANWGSYLQALGYIMLLFFFIPIKYNGVPEDVREKFESYMKQFNKSYDNETVYNLRLQAFQHSLMEIETLNMNKTNESAQYGLTKFSDMLPDEFAENHLFPKLSERLSERNLGQSSEESSKEGHSIKARSIKNDVPQKLDWRDKKVVTNVHNQYDCGACWAFSAIETIESMYAIKNGKLEDLSVQQMIDCAGYNDGCSGGDICSLLYWLKDENVGIEKDNNYPLVLRDNQCRRNTTSQGVHLEDFTCESLIDHEDIIVQLLAMNGPVAVAINAKSWQNYVGGVIQFHCSGKTTDLNHAVQIVGYDLTAKIPHYIVRNTWGEDFGDKGYVYIAIGKNMCGLANEVSAIKVL